MIVVTTENATGSVETDNIMSEIAADAIATMIESAP